MQLDLFIIIAIFSGLALVGLGFVIGRLTAPNIETSYISKRGQPFTNEEIGEALRKANETEAESIDTNEIKPGIVYRPSKAEIDKMNEPQKTREAKEAIAETLAQETPPEI